MQHELAVDRLHFGRLDQLGMRDFDRIKRTFQLGLPEFEKLLQLGKLREKIVGLPDIRLQQPAVIGAAVENMRRRQANLPVPALGIASQNDEQSV
jgi:hypothetical protein